VSTTVWPVTVIADTAVKKDVTGEVKPSPWLATGNDSSRPPATMSNTNPISRMDGEESARYGWRNGAATAAVGCTSRRRGWRITKSPGLCRRSCAKLNPLDPGEPNKSKDAFDVSRLEARFLVRKRFAIAPSRCTLRSSLSGVQRKSDRIN